MKTIIKISFICLILIDCKQTQKIKNTYPEQIGDTEFLKEIDNPNFELCNFSTALHRRTQISFKGGYKKFEDKLIKAYKFNNDFKKFSGYFIIRFAVNCNDETGRFRWEIVDTKFNKTTCPKEMEKEIIKTIKEIKGWKHPIIEGKDYDGHTFITIKLVNGKIIKS